MRGKTNGVQIVGCFREWHIRIELEREEEKEGGQEDLMGRKEWRKEGNRRIKIKIEIWEIR